MPLELPPTFWLVYENEAMRDACVDRFAAAGAEVRPVSWGPELEKLIRHLRPEDWVLVGYHGLRSMGPKFAEPFKAVLDKAHVMVVARDEVPADELPSGWIELTAPLDCAKICRAVHTLTGVACEEPGCCKPAA